MRAEQHLESINEKFNAVDDVRETTLRTKFHENVSIWTSGRVGEIHRLVNSLPFRLAHRPDRLKDFDVK